MAGELITADSQIEWRGLLLGSGTPLRLVELTGWWDLPGVRGGVVPLSDRHGGYQGPQRSASRVITATLTSRATRAGLPAVLAVLRAATAPAEVPIEEALVIRRHGLTLIVDARCVRRRVPDDVVAAHGHAVVTLQWEASDPRLYAATEQITPLGLAAPSSTGGLDFASGGLDFSGGGLDFGPPPTGGAATVTVGGHVPTWPALEIVGPVTGPTVTIGPAGRRLAFDGTWSVLAGQTLFIDTHPARRTCVIAGVSVRQRMVAAEWTPLDPGPTAVRYTAAAYDPTTVLRVRSRDAYH